MRARRAVCERFASPSQVARSYAAPVMGGGDRGYTLGLSDVSADDLAVLRGTWGYPTD